MRYLVIAIVVHTIVLAWLHNPRRNAGVQGSADASVAMADEAMVVEVVGGGGGGGGGGGDRAPSSGQSAPSPTRRTAPRHAEDAWEKVSITVDRPPSSGNGNGNGSSNSDGRSNSNGTSNSDGRSNSNSNSDSNSDSNSGGNGGGSGKGNGSGSGDGNGNGDGDGDGNGNGSGDGIGFGGVRVPDDVPGAPAPPPASIGRVSKARPAKLIFPSRDRDVEDEADLFIAKVTVDSDGDVVGARMVKTRPGSRGDQAADAIWSFRYLPALNDDGVPIRSTFEQPFQIR